MYFVCITSKHPFAHPFQNHNQISSLKASRKENSVKAKHKIHVQNQITLLQKPLTNFVCHNRIEVERERERIASQN